MTTPAQVDQVPVMKQRRRIGRVTVLILGVVVIPLILNVALNSYGPLTVDGALRMAATTVAGQTIAILSAIAAAILTITRGYAWPAILGFVIIAALITGWAVGGMVSAGDVLLDRLDLIAQTDELNR